MPIYWKMLENKKISEISEFPARATGMTFALSPRALRIKNGHARSARASARCGGKKGGGVPVAAPPGGGPTGAKTFAGAVPPRN